MVCYLPNVQYVYKVMGYTKVPEQWSTPVGVGTPLGGRDLRLGSRKRVGSTIFETGTESKSH